MLLIKINLKNQSSGQRLGSSLLSHRDHYVTGKGIPYGIKLIGELIPNRYQNYQNNYDSLVWLMPTGYQYHFINVVK